MDKRLLFGLLACMVIVSVLLGGCSSSGTYTSAATQTATAPSPQTTGAGKQDLPDLMISKIDVFPAQPKAGQYFAVSVYVKNAGQAPSGEFDMAINIKDVSRGSIYPVGTFHHAGLQPGENVLVYSSQNRVVNFPGSHQVWAEVVAIPGGPEDSNPQNNTSGWAFTVVQ